jgi:hypothetical protein
MPVEGVLFFPCSIDFELKSVVQFQWTTKQRVFTFYPHVASSVPICSLTELNILIVWTTDVYILYVISSVPSLYVADALPNKIMSHKMGLNLRRFYH